MSAGTRDEVLDEPRDDPRHGSRPRASRRARRGFEVRIVAAAKTVPADAIRWVRRGRRHRHRARTTCRSSAGSAPRSPRRDGTSSARCRRARRTSWPTTPTSCRPSPRRDRRERLARRAAAAGRRLEALIEVDLTGARSGVPPDELPAFARPIADLEGVRADGADDAAADPRPTPRTAGRPSSGSASFGTGSASTIPQVVELSMGMSLDYEVAVEEGATMVRIGTALFGPRTPQ